MNPIEASTLAQALRESGWAYQSIATLHILGFSLLVGSVAVLDLRILGLSRRLPVSALTRHVLPWTAAALLLIVPSGLALFAAHAGDLVSNRVFVIKMLLLAAAACNAAFFHAGPYRTVDQWDVGTAAPVSARLSAWASIAIWIGVISCGRSLSQFQ